MTGSAPDEKRLERTLRRVSWLAGAISVASAVAFWRYYWIWREDFLGKSFFRVHETGEVYYEGSAAWALLSVLALVIAGLCRWAARPSRRRPLP